MNRRHYAITLQQASAESPTLAMLTALTKDSSERLKAIEPLLWRLDYYGIELSKNAAPLLKYAERIFSRPAYIEALTPSEKVMRK